jgi:hypothetical protein
LHDEQPLGCLAHGTVVDVEVDGPAQQANAGRSPSKNLAAARERLASGGPARGLGPVEGRRAQRKTRLATRRY